jgi:hypothetical protein
MAKPMTRVEWEAWVEKAWATAQESAKEPKEWVGLTDEEIDELARTMVKGDKSVNWLVAAIEARLKEKNT